MKKNIVRAVALATFVLSLPAAAQENPPPPDQQAAGKAAAQDILNSPLFKTYRSAVKDLAPLLKSSATLQQKVDATGKFSFSPETKALLKENFGNDDPLHFTVNSQPGGDTVISTVFDALDYHSESGNMHSEKLTSETVIDRDFKHLKMDAVLPSIVIEAKDEPKHIDIGKIEVHADQTYVLGNMPIGKAGGRVDHMKFSSTDNSFALEMRDLTIDANSTMRNKLFFIDYDYRIAAIDWSSDKVTDVRLDIGLDHLDAQALQAVLAQFEGLEQLDEGKAKEEASVKLLKMLALAASRHNAALELRDVSGLYHGYKAGLTGRISAPNLKEADFDSGEKAFQKVQMRLRVHVPMAMIDELAHRFSRVMMEAQAKQSGTEITDMAVDLVARGVLGKMTDTLVKQQKWAHMEKDELVTVFELKKGKMYLDGHIVNAKSNPFMAMAQGK